MDKLELMIERFNALYAARMLQREADSMRRDAQESEDLAAEYRRRARELERYLAEVGDGDDGEIVIGSMGELD